METLQPAPFKKWGLVVVDLAALEVMPFDKLLERSHTSELYARMDADIQASDTLLGSEALAVAIDIALTVSAPENRIHGRTIDHLMRCALRLMEYYGVTDPDTIAAALLHDTVEDLAPSVVRLLTGQETVSEVDARSQSLDLYAKLVSPKVAHIVSDTTIPILPKGISSLQKILLNEQFIESRGACIPETRVVETVDVIDNTYDLSQMIELEKRRYRARRYVNLLLTHVSWLDRPDSLIPPEAVPETRRILLERRQWALGELALAA